MQRVFMLIWALQIAALFYLVTFFEFLTAGGVPTRVRLLAAVFCLLAQMAGIVYMWFQSSRISDLEYGQEMYSETLHAALTKDPK